ncbi:hypothetical protein BH09ACT8_BH09ACT8_32750 [soil metagenome]
MVDSLDAGRDEFGVEPSETVNPVPTHSNAAARAGRRARWVCCAPVSRTDHCGQNTLGLRLAMSFAPAKS